MTQPEFGGPLRSGSETVQAGIDGVRKLMPPGWVIDNTRATRLAGDGADAVVRITAPDGTSATVVVEAKMVLEGGDVAAVRERLAALTDAEPDSYALVVARYLSRPVRERLMHAGLSYADATGNVLVRIAKPGLHIADHGADRDPWRGPGRPRGTLKGAPAAKVVRALLDIAGPWKIRDLVDASQTSTGSVYRVVEFLDGEELLTRDKQRQLVVPDWVLLLRRWSDDYGFVRSNRVTRWIAPRGLSALVDRVSKSTEVDYAVTGTLAAATWAPYAPARSAMIYAEDAEQVASVWDLRPTETGANVLLAEPASSTPFTRTSEGEKGMRLAAPAQVAVDLMTGPGRAPSEAEELIKWMRRDESAWRG